MALSPAQRRRRAARNAGAAKQRAAANAKGRPPLGPPINRQVNQAAQLSQVDIFGQAAKRARAIKAEYAATQKAAVAARRGKMISRATTAAAVGLPLIGLMRNRSGSAVDRVRGRQTGMYMY